MVKTPYVCVIMNHYAITTSNDKNYILISNGAADCIIFVVHNTTNNRALMCHVTRLTSIPDLFKYIYAFVVKQADIATKNIYMASSVFGTQNYASNGNYANLIGALPNAAVPQLLNTTAFSIDLSNGQTAQGAGPIGIVQQQFPNAASEGISESMGISAEAPTRAYLSLKVQFAPLTGPKKAQESPI